MTIRKSCHIGMLLCLTVLTASLAGCGRKGPLEEPTAAAAKYDQDGSDAANAKAAQTTQPKGWSPLQKQPSFVLDPVLH